MQKEQLTLVIVSMLVVVLSVSLAWFTTQILGKGKDVSVSSANLQITFTDSDGALSATDIEPGWKATKAFTVQNNSKSEYKYNIVIKDLLNTFVTKGYLQYKITSTNNGYNMTDYVDVPKSSTATDTVLAYSVSIPVGVTQTYTIEFTYSNDEDVDQSADMNKKLSGTLFITEGSAPTLLSQILNDNPSRSTRSNNNNGVNDFATPLTTTTTGTLFTSTESIAGVTDSQKEVYYYAGNTTNNWVKFGKYQKDLAVYLGYNDSTNTFDYIEYSTLDECNSSSFYNLNCTEYKYANAGDDIYWRIIRTNHDGSIRLLYVGNRHDTERNNIGKSVFNTDSNSPKYVGYKYGEDTSLDTIRNNTTDSTIKTYIDTWYQNNLTNYTKYLSTSAVYCNDRSLGTGQTYNTSSNFKFAPYYRMDLETEGTAANPSYNCSDIRDAFSVDNTSAKLDYSIALMTVDEMAFAGGVAFQTMSTPYAWFISNSAGSQVSTYWWSLSPIGWNDEYALNFRWIIDDVKFEEYAVENEYGVRPVLSLKSCVKWKSGYGSAGAPYTIEETSTGC